MLALPGKRYLYRPPTMVMGTRKDLPVTGVTDLRGKDEHLGEVES